MLCLLLSHIANLSHPPSFIMSALYCFSVYRYSFCLAAFHLDSRSLILLPSLPFSLLHCSIPLSPWQGMSDPCSPPLKYLIRSVKSLISRYPCTEPRQQIVWMLRHKKETCACDCHCLCAQKPLIWQCDGVSICGRNS